MIKTAHVNENHEFDITQLSDEVKQQLELLNKSQSLIMTIVAGTLMRYKSLDIQKQQILCKALCPEAFEPECQPNVLHEIIYPRQTRKRLIQALEMTENKMQTNPPKKHGNMPL